MQSRSGVRPGAAALVAALIAAATAAAYHGVGRLGFVFDDRWYILDNPLLRSGWSAPDLAALFGIHAANWHPLTWLSHKADVAAFGFAPAGHHLTSLVLHAGGACALFAVLRAMTGALWRPALAAALFALHPLHVESVAWVSERKDVLSGLFGPLAVGAYLRYARAPGPGRYALAAAACAVALTTKPMLVTLPAVLLLLDWWPLGRLGPGARGPRPLLPLADKLPLLALAAGVAAVTWFGQRSFGAMASLGDLTIAARAATALTGVLAYLGKTVWPADLVVLYPHRGAAIPGGEILLAAAATAGLTAVAAWQRRRRPWLAVGWAWFLVMLLPVSGLFQVGPQGMADRFTYLPLVGIFVAVAWAAGGARCATPARRRLAAAAAVAALAALGALSARQTRFWEDEVALYRHALEVNPGSPYLHNNLGVAYAERGQGEEAEREYREALRLTPAYAEAVNNLGALLLDRGRLEEAEARLRTAYALRPGAVDVAANLGAVLLRRGEVDTALALLRTALHAAPDSPLLRQRVGRLLDEAGRHEEAAAAVRSGRPGPGTAGDHLAVGVVLVRGGNLGAAEAEFREAVRLRPDAAETHLNLASLLGTVGRTEEALAEMDEAARLSPGDAEVHYNRGVLLGLMGRTGEAAAAYREALRLRPDYPEASRNLAALPDPP